MRGKRILALLIMVVVVSQGLCGCDSSREETLSSNSSLDIINKLGVGWNLGNTLDSCDYKKMYLESVFPASEKYQFMLTYQTEDWTGWDASDTPYFNEKGELTMVWNMDSFQSDLDAHCGKISFQVFNNEIKSAEEQFIEVQVEQAQLNLKDGTSIELENLLGRHNLVFKDGCSTFVDEKLLENEKMNTTKNLLGGTVTLKAKLVGGVKNSYKENQGSAVEYYETLWGNPTVDKKVIDQVVKSGFGTIRIPITYYDHMDSNYRIDEAWLYRVKEVVGYVLDNNVYCIIDLHHEEKWLNTEIETKEEAKKALKKVWEQIAMTFQEEDEHLIFEGFNEVLSKEKDWSGHSSDYEIINELNQAFVDTVRSTGGKNKTRYLLVNTYAANIDSSILDAFVLPKDIVDHRLLVGVHSYAPLMFSWTDSEMQGASGVTTFDESGKNELDKILKSLYERFTKQGIPVVIGEFGSWNKLNEQDRIQHATHLISEAKKYNIACFWWDMGGMYQEKEEVQGSALFNRVTGECYFPSLVNAMITGVE